MIVLMHDLQLFEFRNALHFIYYMPWTSTLKDCQSFTICIDQYQYYYIMLHVYTFVLSITINDTAKLCIFICKLTASMIQRLKKNYSPSEAISSI